MLQALAVTQHDLTGAGETENALKLRQCARHGFERETEAWPASCGRSEAASTTISTVPPGAIADDEPPQEAPAEC